MLSKKNRLGSLFFKNLFKKGKIVDSQSFSLKYIEGTGEDFKISVVVSKKISLHATERNLLKRRFLSVLLEQKSLLIKGFSYIFYLKKGVEKLPRQEVFHEIQEKITKIYEDYR
jgi:ribonuclease P protein component